MFSVLTAVVLALLAELLSVASVAVAAVLGMMVLGASVPVLLPWWHPACTTVNLCSCSLFSKLKWVLKLAMVWSASGLACHL